MKNIRLYQRRRRVYCKPLVIVEEGDLSEKYKWFLTEGQIDVWLKRCLVRDLKSVIIGTQEELFSVYGRYDIWVPPENS
jgi:hypothetical protein